MKSDHNRIRTGFSLVEITIAMAIVAVVLLPLIAILSQGSGTVTESQDRFATTRIIQSIESEIRYSQEDRAFFIGSENDTANGSFKDILMPASTAGSVYLAFDRSAHLIREISDGEFSTGIIDPDTAILYLVELTITKATNGPNPDVPPLYQIDFSVEQPAFTSEINRTRERLKTLLSGQ